MKRILAADIGGTHARFGHFRLSEDLHLTKMETQWLSTEESLNLPDLLERLSGSSFSLPPEAADIVVIGVAGPIQAGGTYCNPPNIPWDIDLLRDKNALGYLKLSLINDFTAQAYGCRSLHVLKNLDNIIPGTLDPGLPQGIIGPGTGLGKTTLLPLGSSKFTTVASEGGHATFPFVGEEEFKLQKFILQKTRETYVRGDKVLSGSGLRFIHEFLSGERFAGSEVLDMIGRGQAKETLSFFAKLLGRACRDFALDVMAEGGIFLCGGLISRQRILAAHPNFAKEFLNSPTLGHVLKNICVVRVVDLETGLWGSAMYGRKILIEGART